MNGSGREFIMSGALPRRKDALFVRGLENTVLALSRTVARSGAANPRTVPTRKDALRMLTEA
jgi:hypothetical protein